MNFTDKANSVIGKPYDAYKAHCWDLVEYLVEDAPKLEGTATTLKKSVYHFKKEIANHKLKEVEVYKNGDIILLGRNKCFFHAGVYFENGVIHAGLSGVVYQPISTLKVEYSTMQGLRT